MKWLNALTSCAVVLLLCACVNLSLFDSGAAKGTEPVRHGPAGNITRTKGQVFLYNGDAHKQFVVPPVPAGAALLFGNLDSTYREASRNYTWKATALLEPGESRQGEAWFYVDFDPANGTILDARAYAWGMDRNPEYLGFFEKYKGSFGTITEKGFELQIAGASGGGGAWQGVSSNWEGPAAIFIRGSADLLRKKNGARIPFTYEILEIPGEAVHIEDSSGAYAERRAPKETIKVEKTTRTKDELVDKGEGTAILSK